MKKIFIAFTLGFLFSTPFITFAAGYQLGANKQQTVIYKDAPLAFVTKERHLGSVIGTKSAERVIINKTIEDVGNESDVLAESEDYFINFSSEALWESVNRYRTQHGRQPFVKDEVLCMFVNQRLKELLNRGSLDSHAGFNSHVNDYLVNHQYREIAENIAHGYITAQQTVYEGWDKSLAHKSMLITQDLDRGCAAAGDSFAVLIAGKKLN